MTVEQILNHVLRSPEGGVFLTALGDDLPLLTRELEGISVVRGLSGRTCKTSTRYFKQIGATLRFPWWYGHNWAALDECLVNRDFDPSEATSLVISELEHVLEAETRQERDVLFHQFEWLCRGRAVSRMADVEGPYIPLWVVLNCGSGFDARRLFTEAPHVQDLRPT